MARWIDNPAKKHMNREDQRRLRLMDLGLDPNTPEAKTIETIDQSYTSSVLGKPKCTPPDRYLFASSPFSLVACVSAAIRIAGGLRPKTLLRRRLGPNGIAIESIQSAVETTVEVTKSIGVSPSDLESILDGAYGIVDYVGRIAECERFYSFRREWPEILFSNVRFDSSEPISALLSDTTDKIESAMFSAWIVANQQPFDAYLHETYETRRQRNEFFVTDTSNDAVLRRDARLLLNDEFSHLLYPGKRICFVSRRPVELASDEEIRSGACETLARYSDGFAFRYCRE